MKWWDQMPDLCFLNISFKLTFSFASFTFIKRLFSCSLPSAIRVVSSAYLRLFIFLPAILIPACASSSPAFLMMYSAYKLNKQGDNVQPWHAPFPIWNQSIIPCPVLTVASRSRKGGLVFPSLEEFSTVCCDPHSERLGIVNKAEVDVSPELSCFFDYPMDVGNLISGSSAFSKTSLNNWKLTVHVLLKPGLENFEHYFAQNEWDECTCAVVWTFFWHCLFRDWYENWPFTVLWTLLSFPTLLAYWVQHFHSIIF